MTCPIIEIFFRMLFSPPEFSEALREYGTCLLKKTSLNDDEASGEYAYKFYRLVYS